jgi:predicted anti-sigma-YlaC factor YlaD
VLIGFLLKTIPFSSRIVAKIPRWLPVCVYLVLLAVYLAAIIYVEVGLFHFVPPPDAA